MDSILIELDYIRLDDSPPMEFGGSAGRALNNRKVLNTSLASNGAFTKAGWDTLHLSTLGSNTQTSPLDDARNEDPLTSNCLRISKASEELIVSRDCLSRVRME